MSEDSIYSLVAGQLSLAEIDSLKTTTAASMRTFKTHALKAPHSKPNCDEIVGLVCNMVFSGFTLKGIAGIFCDQPKQPAKIRRTLNMDQIVTLIRSGAVALPTVQEVNARRATA